jgi:hypothetical protein
MKVKTLTVIAKRKFFWG